MFMFQSEFEEAALKAYHEDPWTTSEEESDEMDREMTGAGKDGTMKEGGEIELSGRRKRVDDEQMMEGGSASKQKAKSKSGSNQNDVGFLQGLINQLKGSNNSTSENDASKVDWAKMTSQEKEERKKALWNKARRYTNKLRFQARLQKMAESNLKEMMIDDINEDADEENQIIDSVPKLKWYLIDSERTFCKIWDFIITLLTMYTLFITPFLLVFPKVYQTCNPPDSWNRNDCQFVAASQEHLKKIEMAIDIIMFIDILLNFVKKTRAHKELKTIGMNYLMGYFIFDVIATIPELFMNETKQFYYLKLARMVHIYKLTVPL